MDYLATLSHQASPRRSSPLFHFSLDRVFCAGAQTGGPVQAVLAGPALVLGGNLRLTAGLEDAWGRRHRRFVVLIPVVCGVRAAADRFRKIHRSRGSWLHANSDTVEMAMNLVPFAGVAFLWFIAALRDRLGQLEDRFFATVFFGSGILFLGTLFLASDRRRDPYRLFGQAPGTHRLSDPSFRTRRRLRDDEYLRGQDGLRLHDRHIDDLSLYRHCAALSGDSRLYPCNAPAFRQLLRHLELCGVPRVGIAAERQHSADNRHELNSHGLVPAYSRPVRHPSIRYRSVRPNSFFKAANNLNNCFCRSSECG